MKQEEKRKDFNILSLKEIKRKRTHDTNNENEIKETRKRQKMLLTRQTKPDISEVKIKTLDEIRAERAKRIASQQVSVSSSNEVDISEVPLNALSHEESEVSSTSKTEEQRDSAPEKCKDKLHVAKVHPIKRLKRKRSIDGGERKEKVLKFGGEKEVEKEEAIDEQNDEHLCDKFSNLGDANSNDGVRIAEDSSGHNGDENNELSDSVLPMETSKLDEVLLLDEEDFDEHDNTKPEEDILKDIDELLNN